MTPYYRPAERPPASPLRIPAHPSPLPSSRPQIAEIYCGVISQRMYLRLLACTGTILPPSAKNPSATNVGLNSAPVLIRVKFFEIPKTFPHPITNADSKLTHVLERRRPDGSAKQQTCGSVTLLYAFSLTVPRPRNHTLKVMNNILFPGSGTVAPMLIECTCIASPPRGVTAISALQKKAGLRDDPLSRWEKTHGYLSSVSRGGGVPTGGGGYPNLLPSG